MLSSLYISNEINVGSTSLYNLPCQTSVALVNVSVIIYILVSKLIKPISLRLTWYNPVQTMAYRHSFHNVRWYSRVMLWSYDDEILFNHVESNISHIVTNENRFGGWGTTTWHSKSNTWIISFVEIINYITSLCVTLVNVYLMWSARLTFIFSFFHFF